jgi:hypothetical protein
LNHFPQVYFDRSTWASTAGSTEQQELVRRGCVEVIELAEADVVVLAGSAAIGPDELAAALAGGTGLVVLSSSQPHAAAMVELMRSVGVEELERPGGSTRCSTVDSTESSAGLHPHGESRTSVLAEDLLARVDVTSLTATAAFRLSTPADAGLRLAGSSRNPGAPVVAISRVGAARVVVLGVNVGPDSGDLLFNSIAYAARRPVSEPAEHHRAITQHPDWLRIKTAVTLLRTLQLADGSISDEPSARSDACRLVAELNDAIGGIGPLFPHDADYLSAVVQDLANWSDNGFGVPDFLDSLLAFRPEKNRINGRRHLVLFPMYTQNGNPDRNVEAVLIEVIWPQFIEELEAGDYSNKLFVPIRFLDFTPGYDTNSAVLFPETVAMREVPKFSWGAIFADREAARFRSVVTAAADIARLALPPDAARLLADQELAEQTFVLWDLIHDRTHMHGDLPFDPFMIKQRMPYFLYTLEELRCDLTAFRESVKLEQQGIPHARLVQYAILFDRIFRFAITGSRVRNYDGLGGQLLFAWLHQAGVVHWTDNRLTIDWTAVTEPILELGRQIEHLYWQSIDRSKIAHWLAAYELVSATVAPNPMSTWAKGPQALPLDGPPRGLTDAVLPDEFPLSMFYEALNRKLSPIVAATAGITG